MCFQKWADSHNWPAKPWPTGTALFFFHSTNGRWTNLWKTCLKTVIFSTIPFGYTHGAKNYILPLEDPRSFPHINGGHFLIPWHLSPVLPLSINSLQLISDSCHQVNGQDMQEVSHHEAVSVLRNAGSCIKMKVLQERCVPVEPREHERSDTMETDPQVSQEWDVTLSNNRSSGPQSSADPMPECSPLTNRIEATVCNGNGPVGSSADIIKRERALAVLLYSTTEE